MLRKPLPPPPSPGPEGQVSAPMTASARETSLDAPDAPAKAGDALQAFASGSPPPTDTSSTAAPATGGTGPLNGSVASIPKALASAEADAAYSPAPAGSAGIAGMSTNTMTNSSSLQQQPLTGGRPVGVPSLSALPSLGDNPSGLTGAGGAGMGEQEEEEEEEERQRRAEQRAAAALLRQQRQMSAGADERGVFSLETRIAHENRRQDAGGQFV